MKKKHEMTEQETIVYKRQHDYDDAVETAVGTAVGTEEEKIRREKAGSAQNRRRGGSRTRQQLVRLDSIEEEDFELPEEERIAERLLRSARTHKRRLNGLRRYEETSGREEEN